MDKISVSMTSILDYAKLLITERAHEDSIFVDFTMGNGNDTLFLTNLTPNCHVYAFDIQEQALQNTKEKLIKNNTLNKATLILDSHSNVDHYVNSKITAGMFNLGYLPGGDKSITTLYDSSITALKKGLELLEVGGIIVVVIYPGHKEGEKESDGIYKFVSGLDLYQFNAIIHRLINHPKSPYIIAIEKK